MKTTRKPKAVASDRELSGIISVRLADLKDELSVLAKADNRTLSEMIRHCIQVGMPIVQREMKNR